MVDDNAELARLREPVAIGRHIRFSPAEDGIGNAVVCADEPEDGCYWTLIGSGPNADQNRIAQAICDALNARLREPVGDVGEVMRRLQAGICDDKCKIMNVSGGCDCAIAAELLLRQAGEIEEAQRRYDGVYAQWGLAAKLCDEHRTRAETAEARGYAAAREQAEDAISELIVADARTDYERALDDAILALQEERDNAEQAARVEANERRRLQSRLGKAVEALRKALADADALDRWHKSGEGYATLRNDIRNVLEMQKTDDH